MSDPAEEAFQRMLAPKKSGHRFTGNDARDAAREALAPLRKLHRPEQSGEHPPFCRECIIEWPCDSAKHIYPESEL